ncbi:transcription factor JUNGBRUNNEN 1-like [Lolium perenne]|uniref:transcription factor JUNGBRUNNEN 1-like n=1 Tax=Lolium perenne TaxID=4522 RepID=UPI0021F61A73|nr:NAC domain-containing protein 35-like [Lolium perenne]
MVDEHPMVLASRHPSDLELFKKYLIPWIMGNSAKPEFIHQFDVYTADPTELTKKFLPTLVDDGEQAWYFFSPVRAKGRRGPRKARTAGEGCWHSEAGSKPVKDDLGDTIGRRQFFSFVYKTDDGRSRIRTGWLMVELGLHHEKDANRPLEEMVLCKIYFTPRTPSGQGVTIPAVVADGGDFRGAGLAFTSNFIGVTAIFSFLHVAAFSYIINVAPNSFTIADAACATGEAIFFVNPGRR